MTPVKRNRPTVKDWAAAHSELIELHVLPGYSPELNPAECLNHDEANRPRFLRGDRSRRRRSGCSSLGAWPRTRRKPSGRRLSALG
jgi:hypothetical protein